MAFRRIMCYASSLLLERADLERADQDLGE